jgi:signal transduction histidine kinase
VKTEPFEFHQPDFLAVLSHELRNPLSALSNSLYVVQKCQPGEPRVVRALAVMERQLRHMTSLIDALTEAARLGRGGLELRRSPLDLAELLRNACLDHEAILMSRAIELHEDIPAGPLWISADPTRLTQAFSNLLQNAAQFTPAGGRVVVALEPDDAVRRARVRFQDTGVGLAAELRAHLFEPFAQADTSLARSRGGLGLGLNLVRGIVALHGGSVRAESLGPGQGSTFIVELPYASVGR